jgi:hypothetical protein
MFHFETVSATGTINLTRIIIQAYRVDLPNEAKIINGINNCPRSLATIVDEPSDFIEPRAQTLPYAARRDQLFEKYWNKISGICK